MVHSEVGRRSRVAIRGLAPSLPLLLPILAVAERIDAMLRPTVPADTPALLAITQGTGLFLPIDLEALDSVLAAYHEENAAAGHRCFTYEEQGQIIGFVYYA